MSPTRQPPPQSNGAIAVQHRANILGDSYYVLGLRGQGAGLVAYARLCSWADRAIVSEQYTKRDSNQSGARLLKLGSAVFPLLPPRAKSFAYRIDGLGGRWTWITLS